MCLKIRILLSHAQTRIGRTVMMRQQNCSPRRHRAVHFVILSAFDYLHRYRCFATGLVLRTRCWRRFAERVAYCLHYWLLVSYVQHLVDLIGSILLVLQLEQLGPLGELCHLILLALSYLGLCAPRTAGEAVRLQRLVR